MNKTAIILAIAIGMGFFLSSPARATNPTHYSAILMNFGADMNAEKEITLQDWMISLDAFCQTGKNVSEPGLEVESWMLRTEWMRKDIPQFQEPELRVEDWMLKVPEADPGTNA